MRIAFHPRFRKQHERISREVKAQCDESIALFTKNPFAETLRNHALRGKYAGYRSIDVTSDYRAIYYFLAPDGYIFVRLDKHSNLYR